MKIKKIIVLIFISVAGLASISVAQQPEATRDLSAEFVVKITLVNGETKSLVRNATIRIDSLNLSFDNQVEGIYTIMLPLGNHTIIITAPGYQEIVQPVTVFDDGQLKLKLYRLIERKDRQLVGRYPIKMNFENMNQREGPLLGFTMGTGYSQHAASYTTRDNINGKFEEKSGYRLVTIGIEAGYAISPKFFVLYNYKYSPPNTTITPYKSAYHGLEMNFSPARWGRGLIVLGGGFQVAKDKEGTLATGYLLNAGLGYEISPHFIFELLHYLGSMNNKVDEINGNRFLNTSTEFIVLFSVGYLFY